MKKKIWVLVIVIGIIIMLRTIFDSNKNLIYIVAGINIVAKNLMGCHYGIRYSRNLSKQN